MHLKQDHYIRYIECSQAKYSSSPSPPNNNAITPANLPINSIYSSTTSITTNSSSFTPSISVSTPLMSSNSSYIHSNRTISLQLPQYPMSTSTLLIIKQLTLTFKPRNQIIILSSNFHFKLFRLSIEENLLPIPREARMLWCAHLLRKDKSHRSSINPICPLIINSILIKH